MPLAALIDEIVTGQRNGVLTSILSITVLMMLGPGASPSGSSLPCRTSCPWWPPPPSQDWCGVTSTRHLVISCWPSVSEDDTIHILMRYRIESSRCSSRAEAIRDLRLFWTRHRDDHPHPGHRLCAHGDDGVLLDEHMGSLPRPHWWSPWSRTCCWFLPWPKWAGCDSASEVASGERPPNQVPQRWHWRRMEGRSTACFRRGSPGLHRFALKESRCCERGTPPSALHHRRMISVSCFSLQSRLRKPATCPGRWSCSNEPEE